MNTGLLVVLLTIASLTAVALGGGALGLSVMRLARWFSKEHGARKMPAKRHPAS